MRVSEVTTSDGLLIAIHNTTQAPDLNSVSIRIQPHKETSIAISTRRLLRQPKPYVSECIEKFPSDVNVTAFYYTPSYCQVECKSIAVYNNCGCWEPSFMPEKVRF